MRGWRTVAFNLAIAIVGVLEVTDMTELLGSERAGMAMTAIGIVGMVLRSVTTTPVGRRQ